MATRLINTRGARSLVGTIAIVALTLSGCVSAGGGGDLGSIFQPAQRSQSSQRPPPDDRAAFRSIPIRGDGTVDILTPSNLYDLYSEILQTYVDPVDSGTLIEGALKGIHDGAVEQGTSPL